MIFARELLSKPNADMFNKNSERLGAHMIAIMQEIISNID